MTHLDRGGLRSSTVPDHLVKRIYYLVKVLGRSKNPYTVTEAIVRELESWAVDAALYTPQPEETR